jgi:hypothetical protein
MGYHMLIDKIDDQGINQFYFSSIQDTLTKINATYEEQLSIYETNEERDAINDQELYKMLNFAYVVSILETVVIGVTIFGYTWILYHYL